MCVCVWGGGAGLIKSGKLRGPSKVEGSPQSGRSEVLLPENCVTHCQGGNGLHPNLLKGKLQKQRTSGEVIRKSLPETETQHASPLPSFMGCPLPHPCSSGRQATSCPQCWKRHFANSCKNLENLACINFPPRSTWRISFFKITACFQ